MTIVNIAAYKFVSIDKLDAWKLALKERCDELELKGTIILAEEGINLTLAGTHNAIDNFLDYLKHGELFRKSFTDLDIKESFSSRQPFRRMIVRIAKEIITMRKPMIRPQGGRAPSVDARTLKAWLDKGQDDQGRPVVLLDTRNAFEVEHGTFEGAIDFGITKFSQFPEAINQAAREEILFQDKTIVSFCTGGIRCEKAALYMQELKLANVFQLEGGILRYFEEIGGDHWRGTCFVFDERVALDPALSECE
jgi:UPF0176 protein